MHRRKCRSELLPPLQQYTEGTTLVQKEHLAGPLSKQKKGQPVEQEAEAECHWPCSQQEELIQEGLVCQASTLRQLKALLYSKMETPWIGSERATSAQAALSQGFEVHSISWWLQPPLTAAALVLMQGHAHRLPPAECLHTSLW